jgi:hypothetical protein
MVAYDKDNGFALSAGVFDVGMEFIADALSERKDISVSHGMPGMFIRRDVQDQSIITKYRTREISPLPDWAAANKSTGFLILTKEVDEMIPAEKQEFLKGLGVDVDALNAKLEETKSALEEQGIESKEVDDLDTETEDETTEDENVETQAQDESDVDADESKDADTPEDANDETLKINEIALAVAEIVNAKVADAMSGVDAQLGEIKERLDLIDKDRDELDGMSPSASMFAGVLRSAVIGDKTTKVDGRTKEGKDGPTETDPVPTQEGNTPFTLVDVLKSGKDWRSEFEHKRAQ